MGGVAPQMVGFAELPSKIATIKRYFDAYARWGHLTEDGIEILYYDSRCCHVDGVCEWVACDDIVLSRLSGGTEAAPAAGLYAGSSREVAIDGGLNGSTLLGPSRALELRLSSPARAPLLPPHNVARTTAWPLRQSSPRRTSRRCASTSASRRTEP